MRRVLALVLAALPNSPRQAASIYDPSADGPERAAGQRVLHAVLRIPMRDEVALAADMVRPDSAANLPTILVRTPYDRSYELDAFAHFAERGYALVVQSVRGRAESGGDFVPWINERKDGFDTVEWIARQPWSDGKVGMIGASYLGQVQWAAAGEAPPSLRCIVPIVSGTDYFFDTPYDHGILKTRLLSWAFLMDRRTTRPEPRLSDDILKTLPLSRLDREISGEDVSIWDRWLRCDSAKAWDGANFLADASRSGIPALHVSGWWDGELGATMRNYATMRAAGRTDQWLVLGPWPHGVNSSTSFGGVDYGPQSIYDLKSLYLRWFDHWLKGAPPGLRDLPHVQVFVTGANEWRDLDDLPAPGSAELTLHLDSLSGLDGLALFGSLSSTPARGTAPDEFTYDPARVRERFGDSTLLDLDANWKDALLYESDPLEAPIEVGGPGRLELYVSTSAHDTDFFALLLDVDESGRARAITGPGKIRMRYVGGWDDPAPVEPGRVYALELELPPCAHRFAPGHQIALFLCSDWFPDFERNLNTGERIETATRIEVARQRIHHDDARPSVLRLPLLPPRSAATK